MTSFIPRIHRRLHALVLPVALLACSAPPSEASGQDSPPVAGSESWRTDFTKHTVPLEEVVSGGPPKDGIPAIDNPRFETVMEADRWIGDREPVAVVEAGGEVKAYPLQIMMWHEIVNDRVGGEPISVTFCPLCNTTLAFDRRFGDLVLDFGTTGRLRHSDLVMYDRQTETWWQQATGEGIIGEHAGDQLTMVAAPVLAWSTVRDQYQGARVLSRDTGYERNYGQNPYAGYDGQRGPIARFFSGRRDERLEAMERVVALESGGEAVAVPFGELQESPVARVEVGGREVVVFWSPGTASALDDRSIARGRDVGSTAVFDPRASGRELSFEAVGEGRFRDEETGSIWTITGRAVEGTLVGEQLEAVQHGNHFWFAWGVFKPDTRIWRRN